MNDLVYPIGAAARNAWIVNRRPARRPLDPRIPYAFFVENECTAARTIEPVATIFLTNRECPFRCLMCDLWQNTLTETVPAGAISTQIDHALGALAPARHLKLYNSGSFFDPLAIPPAEYEAIAERANRFDRLIVENHPAFVGDACIRFRDLLSSRLEIAMGLETANPEVLAKLNKQMTLPQFSKAAGFLGQHGIDLRVFLLVGAPFLPANEALAWVERSLAFAIEHGATAVTLIPTRGGNGSMEALAANGHFSPPPLYLLEQAMEYGLGLKAGRIFADLWEVPEDCAYCYPDRLQRLQSMNLHQVVLDGVACARCGGLS